MIITNFYVAIGLIFIGFVISRLIVIHKLNKCIKNRCESVLIAEEILKRFDNGEIIATDDGNEDDKFLSRNDWEIRYKECCYEFKTLCNFKKKINLL